VTLDVHRRAFVDALLARDSARARGAIDAALAAGVPIPDVYLDVLRPALAEIGHRWATGELNVAEEHYGTATAQALLDTLSARLPRPPSDGRLAVVTGTPGEQHVLGMRMVADFLEADGWEVLLLGPGAPAHDLVELVDLERPDVVALSTCTASVLPGVVEVLGALGELRPRPLIVVGGQYWNRETTPSAAALGADAVLSDPRELVAFLRDCVPPLASER
jgi:methanogenic corrinoid protein MtbC1